MSTCYWCPFAACARCEHQGGDTPTQQGRKPGLACENVVKSDTLDPRVSANSPGAWTNLAGGPTDMTISATTHTARPGGP